MNFFEVSEAIGKGAVGGFRRGTSPEVDGWMAVRSPFKERYLNLVFYPLNVALKECYQSIIQKSI